MLKSQEVQYKWMHLFYAVKAFRTLPQIQEFEKSSELHFSSQQLRTLQIFSSNIWVFLQIYDSLAIFLPLKLRKTAKLKLINIIYIYTQHYYCIHPTVKNMLTEGSAIVLSFLQEFTFAHSKPFQYNTLKTKWLNLPTHIWKWTKYSASAKAAAVYSVCSDSLRVQICSQWETQICINLQEKKSLVHSNPQVDPAKYSSAAGTQCMQRALPISVRTSFQLQDSRCV